MAVLACSCVKDISSDERLERETSTGPVGKALDAEALAKVSCADVQRELAMARSDSKPEADRVLAYVALFQSLKDRTQTFEGAMARNPDLAYQDGSQALVAAKDVCVQQTADVRVEFERYVRELVDVPTVQEIKGGSMVTVARLDFDTLRQAIEALSPDDKDHLMGRVAAAEKKVEVRHEGKRRGK
ncbi:MAG: hypothetical protein HYZ28_09170 [Myxococcales bacterium]|nr:hypothetical protein [Myxococcales bacterium]